MILVDVNRRSFLWMEKISVTNFTHDKIANFPFGCTINKREPINITLDFHFSQMIISAFFLIRYLHNCISSTIRRVAAVFIADRRALCFLIRKLISTYRPRDRVAKVNDTKAQKMTITTLSSRVVDRDAQLYRASARLGRSLGYTEVNFIGYANDKGPQRRSITTSLGSSPRKRPTKRKDDREVESLFNKRQR